MSTSSVEVIAYELPDMRIIAISNSSHEWGKGLAIVTGGLSILDLILNILKPVFNKILKLRIYTFPPYPVFFD